MILKVIQAITDATILQHFDPAQPIFLQADTSGLAITGRLNQYGWLGTLLLFNIYSRKCSPARQIYDTYTWELLTTM